MYDISWCNEKGWKQSLEMLPDESLEDEDLDLHSAAQSPGIYSSVVLTSESRVHGSSQPFWDKKKSNEPSNPLEKPCFDDCNKVVNCNLQICYFQHFTPQRPKSIFITHPGHIWPVTSIPTKSFVNIKSSPSFIYLWPCPLYLSK